MTQKSQRINQTRKILKWMTIPLAITIAGGVWSLGFAETKTAAPTYRVDPSWPKPLPQGKDAEGHPRQWVTGEPGGSCVDSHDRIITVNRGFAKNGLLTYEGPIGNSMPAPPVVIFDTDGNVTASWGDASLTPQGRPAVMPNAAHGCFVDFEDNIWIAGVADGIVQKYSPTGKLLLQIGTKNLCDGPPTLSPKSPAPTCGEPGDNKSKTLLNQPADVAVDPNPDPATKERGSIYIADGYGNHRVVVFDAKGKYLRQWGSSGREPGKFVETSGGHPHCVVLGNDSLLYTCDRGPGDGTHQTRIEVFDREGNLKHIMPLIPTGLRDKTSAIVDLAFSHDPQQKWMFVSDLGTSKIWIMDRVTGEIAGSMGRPGHMAGELVGTHTIVTDSKDNIYICETIGGRRTQKFVKVSR